MNTMSEQFYNHENYKKPKIGIIGVGGAGCNMVDSIIASGLANVHCVVCNTDAQALELSKCSHKVHLRSSMDKQSDYGAGGNPELGRSAAVDSLKEVFNALGDVDMLFITAGMGGGTGSGGIQPIAQAAKSKGILTIGFVTKPFNFEGSSRRKIADQTISGLQDHVDCLVVAKNQQLLELNKSIGNITQSFEMINSVLCSGIAGIANIVNKHGFINVDFQDVMMVLKNRMNKVVFGVGMATGADAGKTATELALTNQLLEMDTNTLHQVDTVLISITGGEDMSLHAVSEAVEYVREKISADDENIITGMNIDKSFEPDQVEVCIFASCPKIVIEDGQEVCKLRSTPVQIQNKDVGIELDMNDLAEMVGSKEVELEEFLSQASDDTEDGMDFDLSDTDLHVGKRHVTLQEEKTQFDTANTSTKSHKNSLLQKLWKSKTASK